MKKSDYVLNLINSGIKIRYKGEQIDSVKLSDAERLTNPGGDYAYRKILDFLPVPVFIHSDGRFIYANHDAARLHGLDSISQLLGRSLLDFVHKDDLAGFQKNVLKNEEDSHNRRRAEIRIVQAENKVLDIEVNSVPVVFEGKKARLAICTDMTEQNQIRASHLNHVVFLKTLIDTIPNPIFYKDINGVYLGCNKMFAQTILGLPPHKIIGKTVYDLPDLIPKEYADIYHRHDQQLFEQTGIQVYESRVKCADGAERDFIFNKATYVDGQNVTAGLVGVMLDITDLRKVEQELYRYRDKLRGLTSSMTLAEEYERHQIATNLHEQIGQTLAVSKMKLGAIRQEATTMEMMHSLDEIRELISQSIKDARSLTFELSPPVLHEVGFKAAVEWLVEKFSDQNPISFSYQDDGRVLDLDGNIRVLLFRATRELLFNVAFHSKASRAIVSVSDDEKNIYICVEDNGVGFDLDKVDKKTTDQAGLGLFSIQERINHLGGRLEVNSAPGEGTKVTIVSPKKYHVK